MVCRALSADQARQFEQQGYCAPVAALGAGEAESYRRRLERACAIQPETAQRVLKLKSHLVFGCLDELAHRPEILDAVESLIGPDILVWTSSIFAKNPTSANYVSWHQDLTYWGLDPSEVVTAWVALTDSARDNGCMRVVPGSHKLEVAPHRDTYAADNLLSRGQEVAVEVDEAMAVDLVLRPGEMSLHHVKIFHGSNPNTSSRPRVGYAIRYIATSVRQTAGAVDSAMLVRGTDRYGHFVADPRPTADFDVAALAAYDAASERSRQILYRPSPT